MKRKTPIAEMKTVGTTQLFLSYSPESKTCALYTVDWCSGYKLTRAEARAWFDSLDTIDKLNAVVSDAYARASGQEC